MIKKVVKVFFCTLLVLSIVGCNVRENFSSSREIVFYHFDMDNKITYEKIAQSFNKQHPNISVRVEAFEYDDYMQKLYDEKGKLNADVFMIKQGEDFEILSSENNLLKLKKLNIEEHKPFHDILNAGAEGKNLYAAPICLQAYGILYNQEIFDNEGLLESNTIDDFIINIQKLIEKGYVPFSVCDGDDGKEMVLRLFEGVLVCSVNDFNLCLGQENKLENILSDEGLKNSVLYINQLTHDGYMKIDTSIREEEQLLKKFAQGEFAMMIGSSSMIPKILMYNHNFKCKFQNIPGALRDSYSIMKVDKMIGISRKTKNKKEAKCFMQYLLDKNVLSALCDESEVFPTNYVDFIKSNKVNNIIESEKCRYITSVFDRIPYIKKEVFKEMAHEASVNPILNIEEFIKTRQNMA